MMNNYEYYDEDEAFFVSPSYFWSCVTISEDCPFFTTLDPKLHYFGLGLAALYVVLLLILLWDIGFYWSLDNMQRKIEYYMNMVTNKVKHVKTDQKKLITTKERTEKQLKKSRDCTHKLTCLRSAVSNGDPHVLNLPTSFEEGNVPDEIAWNNIKNFMEF